jgi:alkanesulfonate monooxygenase SsuD/methylene tetrahydromethanopterin reductase-like flavin-dependent oxidoreductase (luciferase family)
MRNKEISMQFAVYTPNFGTYSDPRLMADLARDAEYAGWDGFFVWDYLIWSTPSMQPVADPWVTLAALAVTTRHLKLGALVTPMPRRHPWKLARELVTLDHLSNGRMIHGVGIGEDEFGEYSKFGRSSDVKTRAEMLDEGLVVLNGLWSGERFSFEGQHYRVDDAQFLPRPVQQPRIPIWVATMWPNTRPLRRAAQWDGAFPVGWEAPMQPDDFRVLLDHVARYRTTDAPFDVAHWGMTSGPADVDHVQPYADAGVTWWIENISDQRGSLDQMRERIRKGPPKV